MDHSDISHLSELTMIISRMVNDNDPLPWNSQGCHHPVSFILMLPMGGIGALVALRTLRGMRQSKVLSWEWNIENMEVLNDLLTTLL